MKTKVILKSLLDIMLFVAAATLLEAIFNVLGVFIDNFPTLLLSDEILEDNNLGLKSFVILGLINQLLFFVSILFLRKIAKVYRDQKSVYQLKILQYLSISGWCLFVFSGLEILVRGLEFYVGINSIQYSGIASTQKSALLAVLAILMIRLSKIFKKTVEQKKENEFTI